MEKPNAVAWVIRLKVLITKAIFALLLVRLLLDPQMKMSSIVSLANSKKPLHHPLLLLTKSLMSLMSAEDVPVLITAAVLHSKNHGPICV